MCQLHQWLWVVAACVLRVRDEAGRTECLCQRGWTPCGWLPGKLCQPDLLRILCVSSSYSSTSSAPSGKVVWILRVVLLASFLSRNALL